jgi:predicted transcriptional regulator
MIRTQISITDEQARRLRRAAAGRDISIAHLVREAIDAYVTDVDAGRRGRLDRALAAAGRFNSGLTDVSDRHDDYLAEDPAGW